MKKLIAFIIAINVYSCLLSMNYWIPGTEFFVYDSLGHDKYEFSYHLYLTENCDGEESQYCLYTDNPEKDSQPVLIAYILTEGNKVFFKNPQWEDTEWHLMYDFGVQPGEEVTVYEFTGNQNISQNELKCIGYNPENEQWENWPTVTLVDSDTDVDSSMPFEYNWLIGLGDLRGPLENFQNGDYPGYVSKKWEARHNGELLFSNLGDYSFIPTVSSQPDYEIKCDGLSVVISGADTKTIASIYSLNGVLIRTFQVGASTTVELPTPGTYIIKVGDTFKTILAQ